MNLLLDTHMAIWAITDDDRLSQKARELILDQDNTIYFSAISTLEVSMKTRSRKNNLDFSTDQFAEACVEAGFVELPLLSAHFRAEPSLRWRGQGEEHRDPFDRLLLSQAKTENLYLLTHDEKILRFEEHCVIGA